jgi:uncharacterized OB-fold protein
MSDTHFTQSDFEAQMAEGRLMGSKCTACGETYLPPRALCTACYGEMMEWQPASTQGKLRAFTVIHIAPTAMIDAGYGRDNPYCSGIVELDDGLVISAQILGVDPTKPDSIKIGTPVEVEFIQRGEDDQRKTFLGFQVIK